MIIGFRCQCVVVSSDKGTAQTPIGLCEMLARHKGGGLGQTARAAIRSIKGVGLSRALGVDT